MSSRPWLVVLFIALVAATASAQTTSVPPTVRFGGVLPGVEGTVTAVFSLYSEPEGGAPVWTETQTVTADASGRYTVLLGATRLEGVPPALFAAGEPRWIGVRVNGGDELARAALVSVPYALKAADADTVGGRPLSAFVLAGDRTGVGADGLTYVDARVLGAGLAGSGAPGGAGSPNFIGMFSDATTLVNSAIYQSGTSIGINTTAPAAAIHVAAVTTSGPAMYVDSFANGVLGTLPLLYRSARGTPAAPSAVQANDILGGLAVRGYGATTWSSGRGQVMYKAAENWTDSAQGTYLQFTTTPTGGVTWAERMRISPDGNVGIGTSTPNRPLTVGGLIKSTSGFEFPDGTFQTTAGLTGALVTGLTALGVDALSARTGPGAAAFGTNALKANTSGEFNSAFGVNTLMANTTGAYNVALGSNSLGSNTTGLYNTAAGFSSLGSNTSGRYNVAFGDGALQYNTTANENTAVGHLALINSTGADNTAVGTAAGAANTTGSGNTFIGANANAGSAGLVYATAIGANAVVNQSRSLVLGGNGVDAVKVGIGTPTPASPLTVVGIVESTSGGFKFPNGTTQTAAALPLTGGTIAANTSGTTPGLSVTQAGTAQGVAVTSTYSDAVHAESTNGGFGVYGKATGADGIRGEATNARGVMGWSTNSIGVYGLTNAANPPAAGVQGSSTTAAYGVYGTNSANGPGVYGYNTGVGYGVYGQNTGTGSAARFDTATQSADGVQIVSSAPSPYASLRVTNQAASSIGVSASTGAGGTAVSGASDSGIGVGGSANNGIAVLGTSAAGEGARGYATTGKGVYAWANGTGYGLHAKSGTGFGAKIESAATGTSTYALWATNTGGGTAAHFDTAGSGGYAVWASNNASTGGTSILTQGFQGGSAIVAMTDTGYGVLGSASGSSGVGVYGETTGAGTWAGYFLGTVRVQGTLSKLAGSFQIDHPLDPEHKYLSHSFVESPDMKNIYDGIAVLDAAGEAWVTLPDYFEALNTDFRYQLTPMGAAFVPYVAEEIASNRFKIAGGPAGKKVSWQVTGNRQDPYAKAHPIVVEQAKPADEQGTYLVPEVYGQPAGKRTGALKGASVERQRPVEK
jgi:hypothetical protein